MSPHIDQRDLREQQYRDTANLDARIALHARFSTNPHGWMRWIFDRLLALPATCRVLELGCGPGTVWTENRTRVPVAWKVCLTDLSLGMVTAARRGLHDDSDRFVFAVADAQTLPFPDMHFDAVIANHMLYHVPDRERAYAEMRRVLRPGGLLFATTVGDSHMREVDTLVARAFPPSANVPMIGTSGFTLQNGGDELRRWFADVVRDDYEDGLRATEAAPLVAYVLSVEAAVRASRATREAAIAPLLAVIEDEIAAHGAFHVTKESGMFRAVRP